MVHLRGIGFVHLALLGLWILSPLAGQASLRILYLYTVDDYSISVPWRVFDTMDPGPWQEPPAPGFTSLQIKAMYIDALSQSESINGSGSIEPRWDSNGFPLVPLTSKSSDWVCSGDTLGDFRCPLTRWAAYVGVPTYGPFDVDILNYSSTPYPFRAEGNFTLAVPLFEFDCTHYTSHHTNENNTWLAYLPVDETSVSINMLTHQAQQGSGFFFGFDANLTSSDERQQVLFGSFRPSNVTVWHCSVSLATRKVDGQCIDPSLWGFPPDPRKCVYVKAEAPVYSNATILPTLPPSFNLSLSQFWPTIDFPPYGVSSRTEAFLANGNASYGSSETTTIVDLSLIDKETFSARLTTVFNTFWLASTTPNPAVPMVYPLMNATSPTETFLDRFVIVRCHWLFLGVFVLVSFVLLACACLSAWLRCKIHTPDVLGYVSSIVPHDVSLHDDFTDHSGNSSRTGLDRTRELQHLRLRVELNGKATTYWE